MRNPSIMPPQKNFADVPPREAYQRSVFNRTHGHKFTLTPDILYPIFIDEVIPGDTFNVNATIIARLASSMELPIMDNLHFDTFWFYCPNRIVWDNFVRMMGEQDDPADTIDYEFPTLTIPNGGYAVGSIADGFGIPPGIEVAGLTKINSLPFRMYNLIWNQWFRNQLLQDSLPVPKGDTGDLISYYLTCAKRNKRYDYFTSCLDQPQKGDPVSVTLGAAAYTSGVYGTDKTVGFTNDLATPDLMGLYYNNQGGTAEARLRVRVAAYNQTLPYTATNGSSNQTDLRGLGITPNADASGMAVDIDAVDVSFDINDLRLAIATQQYLELNNRGGTRYVEFVEAHFGVNVPDYRLQRPEFLGSSSEMITVSAVHQTTTNPATPTINNSLGAQGAYATFQGRSGFSHSFPEHGFVIGLANIRADITYQQGLERFWSRRTRLDIYDPVFANIGEQAVLSKEIFWTDTPTITEDDEVFGYQEAWAEYRYKPSRISGKLRSNATGTLEAYHLAEDFATRPVLNNVFIESAVPIERIISVTTEPSFVVDTYIQFTNARLMPTYSVPGLHKL